LLLVFVIFIPRLLNLDVFLTPDEPLFLQHAREFAAGLSQGDFSQTLGIGYPGVTVAWWSAPLVGLAQTELGAYAAGRIVTVLVNGLLFGLVYLLARLLVGRWPAFWGVTLLALDPFTLAYSRLLHNELSLALFMTLAGLSFLLWLDQSRRRWLIITGLCTGLALLTKSTALLLGPMLVALLLGWFLATRMGLGEPDHSPSRLGRAIHLILPKLGGLVLIALLAIVVFWALWPAMWTMPAQALELTFGKLLNDQEAGTGNLGFFWLGRFTQDPGPFFYPVAFLLKATPWLLAGLLVSAGLLLKKPKTLATAPHLPVTISLWCFVLAYLILMTIASKKSVRYLLPAFPAFYLLAGTALYQIGQPLRQYLKTWPSRISALLLRPYLPLLFGVVFVLIYHPYYFTYYNPLVLGWLWAPQTLLVGWGEGLDQAARYLNQKPAGLTVSAWYGNLFANFYHKGQVRDAGVENMLTANEVVLYLNQTQRDLPNPHVIHYFRTRLKPEYTVWLNGIEYAWVYPGPLVGPGPDPALAYPLGGEFGGEVRLLGYNLSQAALSGQPLIVTLYWRVLAIPPAERYIFVRLVDAQGQVWAKTDSPPVLGLWPLARWQPNDLVEDAQELPIPAGTPPGAYRLEVGWYDPATGQPLAAGGQPLGQGGGLLLGEVQLGWQSVSAQPELPNRTDTRLAPNAHLVGYTAPPNKATTGDLLPIQLAWREASSMFDFFAVANDNVLFEWRQNNQSIAEQLDPLPLPIAQWGVDALLLSQHQVIVPPTLAAGRYELVVQLHTGSDPAGDSFSLGQVEVTAPPHQFELPTTVTQPVGPAQLEQSVLLAGYHLQPAADSLQVTLYWQTEAPLTGRYRVFAQLLTADNQVMAQSDRFPAEDQRPTTGWLPNEIITDPHRLVFAGSPPPGSYRLIAGLYNPLTGQRLPLHNAPGDAIVVAEVTLQ
jgi:hypothetical protein